MNFDGKIILIRHGENMIDDSISNNLLPLSELGKKQAYEAFQTLKGQFDVVISSPSKRTMMTAHIISPNSKILYDKRLLESGFWNEKQDGLESDYEAKKRIKSFMTEYMESYPNKNILFVTHGGLMILIQEVIEGKKMERGSINNCDIIEYSFNHKKIMKNKI